MKRVEQYIGAYPKEAVAYDGLLAAVARIEEFAHEEITLDLAQSNQSYYKQQLVGIGGDLFEVVAAVGSPFMRNISVYEENDEEIIEIERGMEMVKVLQLGASGDWNEQRYHSRLSRLIAGPRSGVIQAVIANQIFMKRLKPPNQEVQRTLIHSMTLPISGASMEQSPDWSMWTVDQQISRPFSYPQNPSEDIRYISAWQEVARLTVDNVHEYFV